MSDKGQTAVLSVSINRGIVTWMYDKTIPLVFAKRQIETALSIACDKGMSREASTEMLPMIDAAIQNLAMIRYYLDPPSGPIEVKE